MRDPAALRARATELRAAEARLEAALRDELLAVVALCNPASPEGFPAASCARLAARMEPERKRLLDEAATLEAEADELTRGRTPQGA